MHPPEEDVNRQATLLFHLDEAPIHAMLLWIDWPHMMREVAYHFGVVREQVIDCHEMQVSPPDIPNGVVPMIVQQVQDLPLGPAYVLILVDLEIHGHPIEAHYKVAPHVERKVIAVPAQLSRSVLLALAGIADFCRFVRDRCIVEYNLHPWFLQDTHLIPAVFGDYARVQVPPSGRCAVPTRDLIADSRGMPPGDFAELYGMVLSSSEDVPSDSDTSNVSPSLIGSDAIRAEFGPQQDDSADEMGVMQLSTASSSSSAPPPAAFMGQTPHADFSLCTANFDIECKPSWPIWFRRAHTLFGDFCEIEDLHEGPVLYLTTWFVQCDQESTNERSRTARLTADARSWIPTIRRLWIDKIQQGVEVYFVWVRPHPQPTPFERTGPHLILFQNPTEGIVPALFSIRFVALSMQGVSTAVATVQQTASPLHIAELLNLERVCQGRRCTGHHGIDGVTWQDPIPIGENLRLIVPSPGEASHMAIDTHPASVAHVHSDGWIPSVSPLSMRIEDYSPFMQQLYLLWQQQSRPVPVTREHTLEIWTWYLDGVYVSFNDECRPVVLGDDFSEWEMDIRRAWSDLEDSSHPIDFAFVQPVPPPYPVGQIHILAFQQISTDRKGIVVTAYDEAHRQRQPYSAASIVPCVASRINVIESSAKTRHCFFQPGVTCSVWHWGRELTDARDFQAEHGFGLNIIIHRPFLPDWDDDEQELSNWLMSST